MSKLQDQLVLLASSLVSVAMVLGVWWIWHRPSPLPAPAPSAAVVAPSPVERVVAEQRRLVDAQAAHVAKLEAELRQAQDRLAARAVDAPAPSTERRVATTAARGPSAPDVAVPAPSRPDPPAARAVPALPAPVATPVPPDARDTARQGPTERADRYLAAGRFDPIAHAKLMADLRLDQTPGSTAAIDERVRRLNLMQADAALRLAAAGDGPEARREVAAALGLDGLPADTVRALRASLHPARGDDRDIPPPQSALEPEPPPTRNAPVEAAGTGAIPPGEASRSVTVRSGDTLSSIARAHGVPVEALRAANVGRLKGDVIRPGDRLALPEPTAEPAAASRQRRARAASPPSVPPAPTLAR
jgi:hypothetical protein